MTSVRKRRNDTATRFVVCIENREYPASLELHKIYRVLPDKAGSALHQRRIVDESGEDYLYPEKYFVSIELTHSLERALLRAS